LIAILVASSSAIQKKKTSSTSFTVGGKRKTEKTLSRKKKRRPSGKKLSTKKKRAGRGTVLVYSKRQKVLIGERESERGNYSCRFRKGKKKNWGSIEKQGFKGGSDAMERRLVIRV